MSDLLPAQRDLAHLLFSLPEAFGRIGCIADDPFSTSLGGWTRLKTNRGCASRNQAAQRQ